MFRMVWPWLRFALYWVTFWLKIEQTMSALATKLCSRSWHKPNFHCRYDLLCSKTVSINIYLHIWCWHLHCDHSCGPQTLDVCSLLSMVPFLNNWHRPTRWVHCPVHKQHFAVQNEPCHSPAVCTLHWHHSGPRRRHTPSPTVQHGRSPLCQSSGW